jgi:GT2 family glycosyltransferase
MNADESPEVSLVIVSWNSGEELLACLRSLQANPPSTPWEAIVVDNGSTDGSLDRLSRELPWVRLIVNRHNRGLAAANNQGLVASRAPFVVISNPDVIYGQGAIDRLLDLLRRRPRAAFAVASLRHPDGRQQTSAGDLPSLPEALLGLRLSWILRGRGQRGWWWHDWPHDQERTIGHGAEACYAVRREAVGEFGLQDERFVLDWEGVEWSARAWEAGWEIWFAPGALVTHLGGVSVLQVSRRWIASTHLGMYLYFSRHLHPAARPFLAAAVVIRGLIKLLATTADSQVYERAHRKRLDRHAQVPDRTGAA